MINKTEFYCATHRDLDLKKMIPCRLVVDLHTIF